MQFYWVLHRLDQERLDIEFASIKQQHFAELSAAKNPNLKLEEK
jgi:hypothetical protein